MNIRPILIVSGLTILFFLSFLFFHFQLTQAQSVQYKLFGWLWSDNYGLISLNADNCVAPDCTRGEDYNVALRADNTIFGWGWSSNVGWVCFGDICSGTVPSGGNAILNLDGATGRLDGWAKIISLGDDGWIHFSRGGSAGAGIGQACYDCAPVCLAWTQQCAGDPEVCQDVPPCLTYSQDQFDHCNTCFTATYFDRTNIPDPQTESVIGGSGYTCRVCEGNKSAGSPDRYCHKVFSGDGVTYRIKCSNCANCELYGSSSDLSDGSLLGWAWNGAGSAGQSFGAGWIHLNTIGGSSGIVFPWLETQYGSIYTPQAVRQRAGSSGNNATYCIFATDITHVRSALCAQAVITGVNFNFPGLADSGIYRNGLGLIDVEGLITPAVTNGIINKYGQTIENITAGNWRGEKILDNKVYVRNGDLTINGLLTLKNAVDPNLKGNGTVVVRGNLIINSGILYENGLPANLNQLASVGWLVQGDVIIKSTVRDVAGAFIVLGATGQDCRYDDDQPCSVARDYPKYKSTGYGLVFSVDPAYSGDTPDPLTVSGLMVAKAFDFRRTYSDSSRGSEKIIYDGRLIANPPPGLKGFSDGLPIIRDFSY